MDFKSLSDPVVLISNNKRFGFLRNKQTIGGLVMLFLLVAIGLGVYITQKPTQLFPQAADDHAELSIQPQMLTASLNEEINSDIFINTNGKITSNVNIGIKYDPLKLKLLDIKSGTFMDEVNSITPIAQAEGSVTIKLSKRDIKGASGSGILASLKFKVLDVANSQTIVSFDESLTQVKVKGGGEKGNVKIFQSQTLTLNPTQASPSPLASGASPSPSPSPSASGTISSPSPSASATASPPAGGSASPSPLASGTESQKGDGNNDGKVDLIDLSMLYSRWSPATDITSNFNLDFNDDKRINSFDLAGMTTLLTSLGVI